MAARGGSALPSAGGHFIDSFGADSCKPTLWKLRCNGAKGKRSGSGSQCVAPPHPQGQPLRGRGQLLLTWALPVQQQNKGACGAGGSSVGRGPWLGGCRLGAQLVARARVVPKPIAPAGCKLVAALVPGWVGNVSSPTEENPFCRMMTLRPAATSAWGRAWLEAIGMLLGTPIPGARRVFWALYPAQGSTQGERGTPQPTVRIPLQ